MEWVAGSLRAEDAMYQSHWGIEQSPFRSCLDPQFFYASPTHDEALARLHFLVEHQHRLGLLLGPAGSGKSLLLEMFARQCAAAGCAVANVNLLGVEPEELLVQLASQLQRDGGPALPVSALWRIVTDRLAELRYEQRPVVVLLDDAECAHAATSDMVARLARHHPSPEMRLTLVLAAEQARVRSLSHRLLDLAELRIEVEPWAASDTGEFLAASLRKAGCRSEVFDEPAVSRLHELAGGLPRRVARLADLALAAGAGAQLRQIDAGVIDSVHSELCV